MKISRTTNFKTTVGWEVEEITWDELREFLSTPVVGKRKEVNPYVLGELADGRRTTKTVVTRDAITLDSDNGEFFVEALQRAGVACLWHSTFSHAPVGKRFKYRAIVRLTRPVTAEEYGTVAQQFLVRAGIEQDVVDVASLSPAQLMFGPATETRSRFECGEVQGDPFDVDDALANPVDASEWFAGVRVPAPSHRKKSLDAKGDVGKFNNAYLDLDELIEVFDLPYEKVGDRWRYEPSHSQPAMGPVSWDEHLWYSHHATDPAYGRACSAFDLVRIHKFGELDEKAKPNTPVNALPSHMAMRNLMAFDDRVRERTDMYFEVGEGDPNWRSELLVGKNGDVQNTARNLELIFWNDEFFSDVHWSEFFRSTRIGDCGLADTDYTTARVHLSREYRLEASKNDVADMFEKLASSRPRHEVLERLDSLRWDGVPRLHEALPVKEHTDYTRMVAEIVFVSAVARVFDPGCKVDNMLMLSGSQGIGKTTWIERFAMEPEWRAHMYRINPRGDNKDLKKIISEAWIVLADEVQPHNGEDDEVMKAFLTSTMDEFRDPYARKVKRCPRQCVFWGTTNDRKPLQSREGNRRFLIVECAPIDFDALTPAYVEQVWAEAVCMYRAGTKFHLPYEQLELLRSHQSAFTRDSGVAGRVERFMKMRVPRTFETFDGLEQMSHDERRLWFEGGGREFYSEESLVPVTQVCVEDILNVLPKWRRSSKLRADVEAALDAQEGWSRGGRQTTAFGTQEVWLRDLI